MNGSGRESGPSPFTALVLVSQLGLVVAVPIVLGVMAGTYLDRRVNGHGVVLAGLVIFGVGVGVYGAYRLLAKELRWKP